MEDKNTVTELREWVRLYENALQHIAWRLHLALGSEIYPEDIGTIYTHLDQALPFGPPE